MNVAGSNGEAFVRDVCLVKPIIGITSDLTVGGRTGGASKSEDTFFLRARYVRAIEEMGGVPFILPPTEDPSLQARLLNRIEGLLITGSGEDLDPRLYRERKRFQFQVMSEKRARFELAMIRLAVRKDHPVLAICGGIQALNVAMGGSLFQDIKRQIPEAFSHQQKSPTTRPSHSVSIRSGTHLHRILQKSTIRVNSSHHQSPRHVARRLAVNALSPDGVIEGLEAPARRFVIGVQWHPELLYQKDKGNRRLFRSFIHAAAG